MPSRLAAPLILLAGAALLILVVMLSSCGSAGEAEWSAIQKDFWAGSDQRMKEAQRTAR